MGTQTLTSQGESDIFIATFDAQGEPGWGKSFGSHRTEDRGRAVAVDADGGIWLGGSFTDETDFGGGPVATKVSYGSDAFIAHFDGEGTYRWAATWGVADADTRVTAVTPDGQGGVLAAMNFVGPRVVRVAPDGTTAWSTSMPMGDVTEAIATRDGRVYVLVVSEPDALDRSAAAVVLDASSGSLLEQSALESGTHLFTADADAVVAGAMTRGDVMGLTLHGSNDVVIASLDTSGDYAGALLALSGRGNDSPKGLARLDGQTVVSMSTEEGIIMQDDSTLGAPGPSALLLGLGDRVRWATVLPSALHLATAGGAIYGASATKEQMTFGPHEVVPNGTAVFVVRSSPPPQ